MTPHPDRLLRTLDEAATAIQEALDRPVRRGLVGAGAAHPGQHHSDLAADAAAVEVLHAAGLRVLSEESGTTGSGSVTVVVDPLDGSANFLHGIPWFAASLCAVDEQGPAVAVVRNLASGVTFRAVRGEGAERDGTPIAPSGATHLGDAIVGISGYPHLHLGWRQFRALGAAALDLCAVADSSLDAYADCSWDALGPWDFLGAALVCEEAGATVGDLQGRPLADLDHAARRTVVAAATDELHGELLAARARLDPPT